MSSNRPQLAALAGRLGVENGYRSALDQRWVETGDGTREALVRAMGYDGSTEEGAERALAGLAMARAAPEAIDCLGVREGLGGRRGFGLWTNLYTVRSAKNWGFGNFADLRSLIRYASEAGADFVGINPLHALTNREDGRCPYAPVSRLFRNPLYLDVEQILQRAGVPDAGARLGSLDAQRAALRAAPELDPAAVEEVLFSELRPLHAALRRDQKAGRSRGYPDLAKEGGDGLLAFATYQAVADVFEPLTGARDWRRWPAEYRSAASAELRAFRAQHAEEVEFHAWLQLELGRQLGAVAEAARGAGMPIGLLTDLALGSGPGGFDTWAYPDLFASSVSVGAPPDEFSQAGQNWGFPPLDPHALRRDGFAFWRRVLEANLAHAGALRVDHALGLRRLFWIPEGAPAGEGAYVRSPEAELLAVLGEVSRSHGALVIGEDLGTVPPGFSEEMNGRGLLSSRVLLFERDAAGFRPAESWPETCLATANTHDLPPLAGWLSEEDVAIRRATGQIPDDATRAEIERQRRLDRSALAARLVDEGGLAPGSQDPALWMAAATRFLCRTPAVLVGLSLDDLAGEHVPINLPGVPAERHRSWARRMRIALEDLLIDPQVAAILAAVPAERRSNR